MLSLLSVVLVVIAFGLYESFSHHTGIICRLVVDSSVVPSLLERSLYSSFHRHLIIILLFFDTKLAHAAFFVVTDSWWPFVSIRWAILAISDTTFFAGTRCTSKFARHSLARITTSKYSGRWLGHNEDRKSRNTALYGNSVHFVSYILLDSCPWIMVIVTIVFFLFL